MSETGQVSFSTDQFQALMETLAAKSGGDPEALGKTIGVELAKAITTLKEPTPEQAEELEEKREAKRRELKGKVELAKSEEQKKEMRKNRCQHTKPDGRKTIGGQIMQDGLVYSICMRCQTEFQPFPPTPEMMQGGGVNMMQ